MRIGESTEKPIFLQVAESIEDAVLSGAFPEGGQIPSITEFSVTYTINPATALKGINILVEGGILYKKRGVGMFVAEGAAAALGARRKSEFYQNYVQSLVGEAKRLRISEEEIKQMVERGFAADKTEGQGIRYEWS